MSIFSFDNILVNPRDFISPLSEKEIKKLVIDAINAYFDRKIDLQTLIEIAKVIKQYTSFPLNNFASDLDEIISLNFVKEILNDIVEDLSGKIYE